MVYDHALADRIRAHLAHRAGVTEKEMFGGIGFMLQGNMAVGVHKDELMVRLSSAQHATAIAEPHARAFTFGGRSSAGFLLVAPAGTATDAALRTWIDRAVAHVGTLPAKAVAVTKKGKPPARKAMKPAPAVKPKRPAAKRKAPTKPTKRTKPR